MRLSRLPVLLLILTFSLPLIRINIYGMGEVQINMAGFGKVWEEYIANPNSEDAQKIYSMLPDGKDKEITLQVEVRPLISESLNVLERQIFSGDRDSLKIAFRLFTISDTALEQELGTLLGNLIRFNTKAFLEEYKDHRELVPYLSLVVCSFQFNVTGDTSGQELEKKARIKALEYIDDENLKEIKKECIKTLKKCKIK
jgi:hypothetical protein